MEKNTATVIHYCACNAQTGNVLPGDVANHTIKVRQNAGNHVAGAGVKGESLDTDNLTGTGHYYYTPPAAELNADAVSFLLTTTTLNVKLVIEGIYPQVMRGTDGANTIVPATPTDVTNATNPLATSAVLETVAATVAKLDTMIEEV